jgi:hypothetical protein
MLRFAERLTHSPSTSAAVLFAFALGTGACSNGSPGPGAADAPSPSPSATVDVAATASELLRDGFDADFDLSMTMTFLGEDMTARGSGHMTGRDMEMDMTASEIGRQSIVIVGGVTYQKTAGGPWIRQQREGQGSSLALTMAAVDSAAPLRLGKSMTWQDQQVQVLTRTLSGPSAIRALHLKGTANDVTLNQRVMVLGDGTPVRLVGGVTMTTLGHRMTVHTILDFDPMASPAPLVAPTDPWRSVRLHNGLQSALPTSWERARGTCDLDCDWFDGVPPASLVLVSSSSPLSPESVILGLMDSVDERGGTSAQHRARNIGGVTWQVASMVDHSSEGSLLSLTAGAAVIGGRGVVVYSWGDTADPEASEKMFRQFASLISVST